MIHCVFNAADAVVLEQAQQLDESLKGEIVQIRDDYAVGPLQSLYTEEGHAQRNQWWSEILAGGDFDGWVQKQEINDPLVVEYIIKKLEDNTEETLWIWAAQNSHDVSGYYWLVSRLQALQGKIYILYLNNLPFLNEKGQLFYPEWLHTIPPKEFLKAKKLARPVTPSEFEVDGDEWKKICSDDKGVRVLEGGKKLVSEDYTFFDSELKKFIMPEWQKASKIIHQYLHKAKFKTGDAFLLWRLKQLIQTGNYDVQGEVARMKDFEIKYKSKQEEPQSTDS